MDLSLIDQLLTFITLPFQSFLTIEILLIFIILYIFVLYNEKRQNKKVKIALIALIVFFFSLLVFYFSEDIINVLSEIIKTIMRCFYFPNIIFYILTTVISLVLLIYTMLKKNLIKLNKIITPYLFFIRSNYFTLYILCIYYIVHLYILYLLKFRFQYTLYQVHLHYLLNMIKYSPPKME